MSIPFLSHLRACDTGYDITDMTPSSQDGFKTHMFVIIEYKLIICRHRPQTSQTGVTKIDLSEDIEPMLSKTDVILTFALEVCMCVNHCMSVTKYCIWIRNIPLYVLFINVYLIGCKLHQNWTSHYKNILIYIFLTTWWNWLPDCLWEMNKTNKVVKSFS